MRKLIGAAGLSVLLVAPGHAGAEGFFDLFAGAAFTDSNDVKISAFGVSSTTDSDFKTSFSVGGRFGYWFSFFGINLDVDYFRPNFDPDQASVGGITAKTEVEVLGVGLNAMLRARLVNTTAVPDGALQPYVFAGPTVFISKLDFDVTGAGGSDVSVDANLGFTAGTGVTYMFTKSIGLFGEYRFTYNRPTFGITDVKLEPKLNSHHLLGGVTLRF